MSEFKIKVSCELDSSDLEGKLKALGKDQEIKLKVDSSNLDKIETQLKGLKKSFQDAFKIDGTALSEVKKIANIFEKIGKMPNLPNPLGSSNKPKSEVSSIVSEYKDLANVYSKLQKQMNRGTLGEDSIKRTAMQMSELKTNMSQLYDKMDSNARKQVDLFNTKQMNKGIADMNSAMNKIETQATSLGTKLNSISFDHIDASKIEKIQSELKQIQDIAKQDIDLDLNVGDILSDLNRLSSEIKNLEKVENLASSFDKISSSIKDAGGDVENFASSIKELENSADKIDGSFDKAFKKANDGLKDMQSSVKKISSDTKGGGLLGSIFGSKDDFLGNFSQFKLLDMAGDFIASGISQMASAWKDTVIETDGAIVDLKKVYDKNLTGDNLKSYLNNVTEVAKGTGKTSVDVIQGTAKGIQSGIKDLDDALVFARKSAIFANVGDMEQGQADTMLASVTSAYGGIVNSLKPVREQIKGASKDYSTLDKFLDLANYSGNNFAVTTSDIGIALQESASALQTNGVSLEKSVAMATAMNEVLQNSSRSGNALKSISANMAGVTTSAKTGEIQSNKTAKALKEIANIEVWDKQTGQVKDMYSVMDELSGKWDSLSEVQQNALGII